MKFDAFKITMEEVEELKQGIKTIEDKAILNKTYEIMENKCQPVEREWYGKSSGKALEKDKFIQIGGKIPPMVAKEFKALPGRLGHNLEKALKLYLLILKEKQTPEEIKKVR